MVRPTIGTVRLADSTQDHVDFGVLSGVVADWENAQRAAIAPGGFEWWYADAVLPGGRYVAVVFFTKPLHGVDGPLQPQIFIGITDPTLSPSTIRLSRTFGPADLVVGRDNCDVAIAGHRFRQVAASPAVYEIEASIDAVSIRLRMRAMLPPLRRGTGHLLFHLDGERRHFAWLPAVPSAEVEVTYTVNGHSTTTASNLGYHDHNWGNADPATLLSQWYWGRATLGPYVVITAHLKARKAYGEQPHVVFLVLKDGQLLSSPRDPVVFELLDSMNDSCTGRAHAKGIRMSWQRGASLIRVQYTHQRTVLSKWLDGSEHCDPAKPPPQADALGVYLRFFGTVLLEHFESDALVAQVGPAPTLWEFMEFAPDAQPGALSHYLEAVVQARGAF